MFDFIRNHRRWMQLVLLLLIVPAFAFFGIEGYVGFMSKDKELAEVNGNAITLPEFDMARRSQLEELRSVLGTQFDPQALDTPAFRERLLNDMIDQRVVAAAATEGRYTVSDETLRQTIADVPALQDNGQFSPERYRQILAAQGMTPADFEMRLRSDLILAQVLGPIGSTASAPKAVVDSLVSALTQERTVAVRRFVQSAYEADAAITDEQVKAWYDSNAESLRLPESVDIEYLVLDEAAATRGVSVSDAEIDHFYKQNQNRYGQPERRRVSHILFEVAPNASADTKAQAREKATQTSAQLKADPARFAALAKERSQDPGSSGQGGDLGWISKDTLVPEVEKAVFSLNPGEISEVVESPFGFHVVTVTEVQPPSIKPLDQVRDDIASQIRLQLASAKFADMAGQLTNLVYDQRDSLGPIAQQLGVDLKKAQGLAREGLLGDQLFKRETAVTDDVQTILNHPRVRQIAFSEDVMRSGENSGSIELAPDTILALRVTKINPSVIPSLDVAAPLIREDLVRERALSLAREAGKAALVVAKEQIADPTGFAPAQVVSRQNPRDMSSAELAAVMSHSQQDVPAMIGVDIPNGFALLHLQSVSPGQALDAAELDQFRGQLSQAAGRSEEQAALTILRQKFNAKITPEGSAVIDGSADAQ